MPLYFDNICNNKQTASEATNDYTQLTNLPTINGTLIIGNVSLEDLGIGSVFNYSGTVETKEQLPKNPDKGDVYTITSENKSYVYSGTDWIEIGSVADLSNYVTKDELKSETDSLSAYLLNEIHAITIPTKISELENDSNFITEIPKYYVTEEHLSHVLVQNYVAKDNFNDTVEELQLRIDNSATKIDLDSIVSRIITVENKLSEVEKSNIEVVIPEPNKDLVLIDNEKDYIITSDVSANTNISGKSVSIKNASITGNSSIVVNAEKEISMNAISLNGEYPTNAGKVIKVDNSEYIVIRDSEFNAKAGYNLIEIGLEGNNLPKSVLIENCKFTGKYTNNAILIFGTQDNAIININNCYFEDVSNCIRLSNKTNAKNVIVNITNCVCDKWDSADKWAGLLICQDYTSGSIEAEVNNNLFAPEKIIINISNFTLPNGERLVAPKNLSDICGTLDARTQVIYVWNSKGDSIPYSVEKYPNINIM